MKKIKMLVIFLIAIAFILFPLPAKDILIRFHFDNAVAGPYALYYATESTVFAPEQCVVAEMETTENGSFVSFRLDNSLEEKLSSLRLDFPAGENLLCINNITVSSAGVIQKQFAPCTFFASENLVYQNHISDISLVTAQNKTYIATSGNDPYIILSNDLCSQVKDGFSHLLLTRLVICVFVAACYFVYKKDFFQIEQ